MRTRRESPWGSFPFQKNRRINEPVNRKPIAKAGDGRRKPGTAGRTGTGRTGTLKSRPVADGDGSRGRWGKGAETDRVQRKPERRQRQPGTVESLEVEDAEAERETGHRQG